MMSHLIKIYAVCKFSYFRLWYLNSLKNTITEVQISNKGPKELRMTVNAGAMNSLDMSDFFSFSRILPCNVL